MSLIASPPAQDSLIETEEEKPTRRDPFYIAKGWLQWLQDAVIARIQAAPEILIHNYQLTNQNASLGSTPIPIGNLPAGVYEVECYVRPTTADGVSSSIAVALGWTENALALSRVVATVAGAPDSVLVTANGRIRVLIDAFSPLTYATVYASNTPGQMRYKLQITVKSIGLDG
jgi:hypothetical protein